MRFLYWPCLVLGFTSLVFIHTHTDELPFVLGNVAIVSAALCHLFPDRAWITALVLGSALFSAETMVHLLLLRAPYAVKPGVPWAALSGYVPTTLGTAVGTLSRRPSVLR